MATATKNYPFQIASNYTVPPEAQILSEILSLKLQNNPGQNFTETFDSDTGFTYDNTKSEFIGGLNRQIDQTPANVLSWATFNSDINLSGGGGVLTGTGTGSPTITGNKLDLSGDSIKYVTFDANNNMDSQQVGTVRMKVTPDYNNIPANDLYLFSVGQATGVLNNLIQIYHNSVNGRISYVLYNSAGALQGSGIFGVWSPTSGTTYELTFCFDFTTGATRMFVNGVQNGSTLVLTFIRDSNIGFFRIGSDRTGAFESDMYVEDFAYYNTVLYTANYTPGYTLPEAKYLATTVTLPEMEYTGPGTLISFDNFLMTLTGAPRITLQIGRSGNYLYWNGSSWVNSDGTYAQANSYATFLANISSLSVFGEIYGQFKIHYDNSTSIQSSVAELTASLTAQIYVITNPTTITLSTFRSDGIVSFLATITKTGNDEVKFRWLKDNIKYYYNLITNSWEVSNGDYTQANTATEMNTYSSSFLTTGLGGTIALEIDLHSDNGTTTPTVSNISIIYNIFGDDPTDTAYCLIFGWVSSGGIPISGAKITIKPTTQYSTQDGILELLQEYKLTSNTLGYWGQSLPITVNMDILYTISIHYQDSITGEVYHKQYNNIIIPNVAAVNLTALI